jgi:uncharacterized protein YndB with AHSA1/START domain
MTATPMTDLLPITKTVEIMAPAATVFDTFVTCIGDWWPLARFSRSRGSTPKSLILEPRSGGAIYEISADGERLDWGSVITIDPPHSIVMAWHLGRPAETKVYVTFEVIDPIRTRVQLEHSGWDKLEAAGATVERQGYEAGWEAILERGFVPFMTAKASKAQP